MFNEKDAVAIDDSGSVPVEIFPRGTHVELQLNCTSAIEKALSERTDTERMRSKCLFQL